MKPPVLTPDGKVALPPILPQEHVPCEWCSSVAHWDRRWAERGDTLLYSHICPECHRQTVSEYAEDGKVIRRKGRDK